MVMMGFLVVHGARALDPGSRSGLQAVDEGARRRRFDPATQGALALRLEEPPGRATSQEKTNRTRRRPTDNVLFR
jgi:hypothetical protein